MAGSTTLNLDGVLKTLETGSTTQQKQALEDYRRILNANRHNTALTSLKDRPIHLILDRLFSFATSERAAWLKSSKSTLNKELKTDAATGRLSLCAAALRSTVDLFLRQMRPRTVMAVLGHVNNSIADQNGEFVEPIIEDYFRCLHAIFNHRPHIENLDEDAWHEAVELVLDALDLISEDDAPRNAQRDTDTPMTESTTSRVRGRPNRFSNARQILFGCLLPLLKLSNRPLAKSSRKVLELATRFLESVPRLTPAHLECLQSLNALFKDQFHDGAFMIRAVRLMMPVLRSLIVLSRKPILVREEVLISVIYLQQNIAAAIRSHDTDTLILHLTGLHEAMIDDYLENRERHLLALDDMCFIQIQQNTSATHPLALSQFKLREISREKESQWSTLKIIAFLANTITQYHDIHATRAQEQRGASPPLKRARTTSNFEEVLSYMALATSSRNRIGVLQVFCFVIDDRSLSKEQYDMLHERCSPLMASSDPEEASWAMILIANCSNQSVTRCVDSKMQLLERWRIAMRGITSAVTCRASSHLAAIILDSGTLEYDDVSDSIENVLATPTLTGPASLCDSSIQLWTTILATRASQLPGQSMEASYGQFAKWLCARWDPGNFESRRSSRQMKIEIPSQDLVRAFLSAVSACQLGHVTPAFVRIKGLGQAWLWHTQHKALLNWLLQLDAGDSNAPADGREQDNTPSSSVLRIPKAQRKNTAADMLLEFLTSQLEKTRQRWSEIAMSKGGQLSPDMLHVAFSLCLAVAAVTHALRDTHGVYADSLRDQQAMFVAELVAFSTQGDRVDKETTILDAIAPLLPSLHKSDSLQIIAQSVQPLAGIIELLSSTSAHQDETYDDSDANMDDLDDEDDIFDALDGKRVESGASFSKTKSAKVESDHFEEQVLAYLHLLANIGQTDTGAGDELRIHEGFVNRLIRLPRTQLLAARSVLSMTCKCSLTFEVSAAQSLLRYFGEEILRDDEWSQSEASILFLLESLMATVDIWTDPNETEVAEDAADLYKWLLNTALAECLCSTACLIMTSDLLYRVLRINAEYTRSLTNVNESVRTTLFKLLQSSNVVVQQHIAEGLSSLFEYFTVNQHQSIYDDILGVLPSDAAHTESLFVRLTAFTYIGSSWKHLLSQCLYNIFETAGQIPEVEQNAQKAIQTITHRLHLKKPQQLFALFAPQLLYTWLEDEGLEKVPYRIFAYETLDAFIADAQGDLISFCITHGPDARLLGLAKIARQTPTAMVFASFAKVVVHSFAYDASAAQTDSGLSHEAEGKVRNLIKDVTYIPTFKQHFRDIVGLFFLHIDTGDNFERSLAKKIEKQGNYTKVLETFRKINAFGSIGTPLNQSQSQQPSWRSRPFLDQLERACRRVGKQSPDFITPPLAVFVSRVLFNDMHEAFGAVHACRVLQRLKILIAFAGKSVLSGYSLEALLHGLKHYVVNKQTADYALPLVQYLIGNSQAYLAGRISFTYGFSISTILSMRHLLNSTQDSTTQESNHKAMITRATKFRDWLCTALESLLQQSEDAEVASRYSRLVSSTANIRGSCSGAQATPESRLLLELLHGSDSTAGVLEPEDAEPCRSLLCLDFSIPVPICEDTFRDDCDASQFAAAVWFSLSDCKASRHYRSWASRALGRAYQATGQTQQALIRESSLKTLFSAVPRQDSGEDHIKSSQRVVASLSSELRGHSSQACGLAESTLEAIVVSYARSQESAAISGAMPRSFLSTFISSDPSVGGPPLPTSKSEPNTVEAALAEIGNLSPIEWTRRITIAVLNVAQGDPLLDLLRSFLDADESTSNNYLPYALHLVAKSSLDRNQGGRERIAAAMEAFLSQITPATAGYGNILVDALLYLRGQRFPKEHTALERHAWIPLDLGTAANAALTCGMPKTALLFSELGQGTTVSTGSRRTSRRESVVSLQQDFAPTDLLSTIFRSIDEPDSFYGVEQHADLEAIAERLEFEGDGIQSLLYRGAQVDSVRRADPGTNIKPSARLLTALSTLNLNSLVTQLANDTTQEISANQNSRSMVHSALKLGQWDLPAATSAGLAEDVTYRSLQSLQNMTTESSIRPLIFEGMADTCDLMHRQGANMKTINEGFQSLAALCTIDRFLSHAEANDFDHILETTIMRRPWMESASVDAVQVLLTGQEAFTGVLNRNRALQQTMRLRPDQAMLADVGVNLMSSAVYRKLGVMQEALSSVTYASKLTELARALGLCVDAAVQKEVADVLWDRGEYAGSIKTLQALSNPGSLQEQAIPVGRAGVLADLAHHVSFARLEKPDDILNRYLRPALKELGRTTQTEEAGKVFHEYASYCHTQLDSPETLQDLQRFERNARQREIEKQELKKAAISGSNKQEMRQADRELQSVKRWLALDIQEVNRLKKLRKELLKSGLENYLRSLAASDQYDTDVIRFLAIWLAHAEDESAASAVAEYAPQVASRKFVPLMNQLGSRLQDTEEEFQNILGDIVLRVCQDHPYHGMYHVFAGAKTSGGHDSQAQSRQGAASKLAKKLAKDSKVGALWKGVSYSNELYNKMARMRGSNIKQGAKLQMKEYEESKRVYSDIPRLKIPPITIGIEVRVDRKYENVPKVVGFGSEMTVPGGVSAPKIVTCKASDGRRYKQLFKGGSDDLRQDAIMEQVFEQVSALLKTNKATRQRDLRIRTYKVVPLDAQGGAIEFVEPTMSIGEFLEPAHHRYHPKDLKWQQCRGKISDVSDQGLQQRINTFKEVCLRMQPVMRHFFFERFVDPDDWFDRRLAYTRSTAAISILGHVLGLGDRHCHNILLDTSTGEVVHIDLGVAFEAGRILPKPETVPFRLTRDIVDGFGILKTEGVFRRCCEFTLEALRQNKDTILTLLNVLRYDPLYIWSVSPLRAKRLQNEQQESRAAAAADESVVPSSKSARRSRGGPAEADPEVVTPKEKKKDEDEGGEADRALSTVERKLAAGLSVSATVNELIQQATDEKNLAQLFHGWSAFA